MSSRVSAKPRTTSRPASREEAINIDPEVLALAMELARAKRAGKLAELVEEVREVRGTVPLLEYEERERSGKKVIKSAPAAEIQKGKLHLFNDVTRRYVAFDLKAGRELRQGPNAQIYKDAARALGFTLEDVKSRGEAGTSKRSTKEEKEILIKNPKTTSRAKEIEYGSREFIDAFDSDRYRADLIANLRRVRPDTAKVLEAVDPNKIGLYVETGKKRGNWIKIGKGEWLRLALENPSEAARLAKGPAYTEEERKNLAADRKEERASDRSSSRKAIQQDIKIKNPYPPKRPILYGGATHVGIVKNGDGDNALFDNAFRDAAHKAGKTDSWINEKIAEAHAVINGEGPARSRSASRSPSARSASRSPSVRATSRSVSPRSTSSRSPRTPEVEEEEEAEEVAPAPLRVTRRPGLTVTRRTVA